MEPLEKHELTIVRYPDDNRHFTRYYYAPEGAQLHDLLIDHAR
jgi:hypothetical protein